MSRIIVILELVLGVLALSIYLGGGDLLSIAPLSPFLLIMLFPLAASLAIWPFRKIFHAFRNAANPDGLVAVYPESEKILHFCEKISIHGAIIGLIVGMIIMLNNIHLISTERIIRIGNHFLIGLVSALVIFITLRQTSGIFLNRKYHLQKTRDASQQDELKQLCARYGITMREREIIRMIANGSSNREICRTLDITDDTVKNHVYNIFRKTGVRNRNGLVGLLLEIRKTK
jgi:DNA-binding CsgD family transcriptional regulator